MEIRVTRTRPVQVVFGGNRQPRIQAGALAAKRNVKVGDRFKEGVSVITCTNRPEYRERIIQNYIRQDYDPMELIIIVNHNETDLREWQTWVESYPNVRVFQLEQSVTLGECLNYAVDQARYSYVAKFDDDDYYAPGYLQQAMDTFKSTNADIVGKCSMFVYFEGSRTLAIAHPNQEDRFVSMLAGATMVINRRVFNLVKFKNLNHGEDTDFQNNCSQLGIKMYSSNRYNYACVRRARTDTHTWRVEEDEYRRFCEMVDHMDDFTDAVTAY